MANALALSKRSGMSGNGQVKHAAANRSRTV
jgi:hypothetical protein